MSKHAISHAVRPLLRELLPLSIHQAKTRAWFAGKGRLMNHEICVQSDKEFAPSPPFHLI